MTRGGSALVSLTVLPNVADDLRLLGWTTNRGFLNDAVADAVVELVERAIALGYGRRDRLIRIDTGGRRKIRIALIVNSALALLGRALRSASNDATMMVEDALLPLRRDKSVIKSGNMNLHSLPWPREELLALGGHDVELRITLSYFIEPNPGERGWERRHRYASHGLRFELNRSLETITQFRLRINKAAEAEEASDIIGRAAAGGDDWALGPIRNKGSIHSDIWRGSATELAARGAIGVFPIGGWWKEKPRLRRWDRSARYALLVSIRAPEAEVDLYTAIANQLVVPIPGR